MELPQILQLVNQGGLGGVAAAALYLLHRAHQARAADAAKRDEERSKDAQVLRDVLRENTGAMVRLCERIEMLVQRRGRAA